MADFDPFANQGGAAAWDPEHAGDTRKQADELLKRLAAQDDEPGSGPSTFTNDDETAERDAPDGATDIDFDDTDVDSGDPDRFDHTDPEP